MEQWMDVKGFESLYQISDTGKLKAKEKNRIASKYGTTCIVPEKILKPWISNMGYKVIHLCKDAKTTKFSIHSLVASHFVPNPNDNTVVNHKDGDKLNNSYRNLEWTTYGENNKHAYATGLKKPFYRDGENNPRSKHTNQQRDEAVRMSEAGKSLREIGQVLGIKNKSSVHSMIKARRESLAKAS